MTKLEELRAYQAELDADPDFVDVKFSAGPLAEATDEQIAADALALTKGTGRGVDISDIIL
jgi:hypothetical protein